MKLIVNGDDFGSSEAVNLAVAKAHDEGILTSCSLMVGESAFEQAVEIARKRPRLGVGLHLVTVLGKAVLPASEIPTIVDSKGYFPNSPVRAGLRYFFLPSAKAHLRREIKAQMQRFVSTGLKCSHIDGHLHMHLHPTVFPMVIEIAREYDVKYVRLPRENLSLSLTINSRHKLHKYLLWFTFWLLCKYAKLYLQDIGAVEQVYGLLETGRVTESYLVALLERLSCDTAEVYLHPQVGENQAELDALLSLRVKSLIKAKAIELVSYHQL